MTATYEIEVVCPYCERPAELVDSIAVYAKSHGPIWLCRACRAWVGCHRGTCRPLGVPANAELRSWRRRAHEAFDPLWKLRVSGRGRQLWYLWLAAQLGVEEAHIGEMDVDQCRRVVEVCGSRTVELQNKQTRS